MTLKIDGALFDIGTVAVTDQARRRAIYLQRRTGKAKKATEDAMVSVHSSILLKLHATGQFGEIHASDRILNRNNIQNNKGRVLSVIGDKYTFVIITELPEGNTLITTPEEV